MHNSVYLCKNLTDYLSFLRNFVPNKQKNIKI